MGGKKMRRLNELEKKVYSRLKTTFIFLEGDEYSIKICPSSEEKVTSENLTILFVPNKTNTDSFLLDAKDFTWTGYSFDYMIDQESTNYKSKAVFYHDRTSSELVRVLDLEIGRKELARKFSAEELKNVFFFVEGTIYPATDENVVPTKNNIKIYSFKTHDFETPIISFNRYYIGAEEICEMPEELYQIIKEVSQRFW